MESNYTHVCQCSLRGLRSPQTHSGRGWARRVLVALVAWASRGPALALTRAVLFLFILYLRLMLTLSFDERDLNFENYGTQLWYLLRSNLFGKYLLNFEGFQSHTQRKECFQIISITRTQKLARTGGNSSVRHKVLLQVQEARLQPVGFYWVDTGWQDCWRLWPGVRVVLRVMGDLNMQAMESTLEMHSLTQSHP